MSAPQILAVVQAIGTGVMVAEIAIPAVCVAIAAVVLIRYAGREVREALLWPVAVLSALRPSARRYGRHARHGGAR